MESMTSLHIFMLGLLSKPATGDGVSCARLEHCAVGSHKSTKYYVPLKKCLVQVARNPACKGLIQMGKNVL